MSRESSNSRTGWALKGVVLLVLVAGLGVVIWSMLGSEPLAPAIESSDSSSAGAPERSAPPGSASRSNPVPRPFSPSVAPTADPSGEAGARSIAEAPRRGVRGTVKDASGEPIGDALVSARIQVFCVGSESTAQEPRTRGAHGRARVLRRAHPRDRSGPREAPGRGARSIHGHEECHPAAKAARLSGTSFRAGGTRFAGRHDPGEGGR